MRAAPPIALLAAALAAAGCGSGEKQTPAACLGTPQAYVRALGSAPGKVELAPGTPISSCLTKNQGTGDMTTVGTSMIGAATQLNAEARRPGGSKAALEAGYLVGAAANGAAETGGIDATLVDRLTAAARYSPGGRPLPPGFDPAYRTGYAAGRSHG